MISILKSKHTFLALAFSCVNTALWAQNLTANRMHSHNNYKQNTPFPQDYYAGAGSI
ncbi:hypothetical protein MUGA111182_06425 [Mucilaginibacter galii]